MSGPLALLQRVEEEVAALLAAGTASPRAERRRLAELAEQVAALKLERLAVELRGLVGAEEPRTRANGALTALVMARKLRERLLPWPTVPSGPALTISADPPIAVATVSEPPADPDLATLAGWLASGPDLLRAHAARLLIAHGEEAVPHLARLAKAGTVTVRREAVAALGEIAGEAGLVSSIPTGSTQKGDSAYSPPSLNQPRQGLRPNPLSPFPAREGGTRSDSPPRVGEGPGERSDRLPEARPSVSAFQALLAVVGDADCWRQLREALLPHGESATPPPLPLGEGWGEGSGTLTLESALAQMVRETEGKKDERGRRLMAAALLYRLGAYRTLSELVSVKEEHAPLLGLGLAARARVGGAWQEPPETIEGVQWGQSFPAAAAVALARAECAGDPDPACAALDGGPVNQVEAALRWTAAGGPLAAALSERYLARLSGGNAKERQRAARALSGLADPALTPVLLGMLASGEVDLEAACLILAECGDSYAAGVLLDMAAGNLPPNGHAGTLGSAIKTLGELGDPGTLPPLVNLLSLAASPTAELRLRGNRVGLELALAAFGDAGVDYLSARLRADAGGATAGAIQQVLLQMKGKRAKEALKETDVNSDEALLARLGHTALGAAAAKELARRGAGMLERLEARLEGPEYAASLNALAAVADIGGPRAYEVVHRTVERIVASSAPGYGQGQLGERAIKILGRSADSRGAGLFVRALGCPLPQVQNAAVAACLGLGEAIVPRVLPLLDQQSPRSRAGALAVLGQLRVVQAQEKALSLLADPDSTVSRAAATALGEIGAATGEARLAEALGQQLVTSGDWSLRMAALTALPKIGRREAIPYLKKFAESGTYNRQIAESAIKKIEQAAGGRSLAGRLRGLLGGH